MPVLTRIGRLVTCAPAGGQAAVHPIDDAALAWADGRILWAGPEAELPPECAGLARLDAGGRLVTPGLVDCHTHLAFGGWRADEFAARALGRPYLEIARAGGGIQRTVRQTRAAPAAELLAGARRALREMTRLGTTTVECKSGYGLELETELKLLGVYRDLAGAEPNRLVSTFLGAHVVAPEYAGDPDGYVALLVEEMIPAVAERGLARFCDAFVEDGAFSAAQARAVLEAGRAHGLRPKLHADQLSDGGGAALAAELGAASADHLEHVSDAGIDALRRAGVVAVSLPLATFCLRQPPLPARRLIEAGVPLAVATDFNPGSAPSAHLPFVLSLACVLQRMSPDEALKGATLYAAQAIGMEAQVGSLEPGKCADFLLVDAPDVNHWLGHIRASAVAAVWIGGAQVWPGPARA